MRLQRNLRRWLAARASDIAAHGDIAALLKSPWTKDNEDRTDALLCALIGWQWTTKGRPSMEIVGDEATGFLVLPEKETA